MKSEEWEETVPLFTWVKVIVKRQDIVETDDRNLANCCF